MWFVRIFKVGCAGIAIDVYNIDHWCYTNRGNCSSHMAEVKNIQNRILAISRRKRVIFMKYPAASWSARICCVSVLVIIHDIEPVNKMKAIENLRKIIKTPLNLFDRRFKSRCFWNFSNKYALSKFITLTSNTAKHFLY